MGILGTGVIAGVANSALQSQQLGRLRDKQTRDARRAAQRQQEIRQIRIAGLEEDDAAADITGIRIDGQVPDHERHDHPEKRTTGHPDQPHPQPPTDTAQTTPMPAGPLAELPYPDGDGEHAAPPEPQAHVAAAYQHSDPEAEAKDKHRLDLEG